MERIQSTLNRYGAATITVGIATLVQMACGQVMVGAPVVALMALSIGITVWRCGNGPGVLASILAVIIGDHLAAHDQITFRIAQDMSLMVVGLLILALSQQRADRARMLAVHQDQANQRRRTEESLARERHRLQILMDNTPDTIYFKDRESRFVLVNQAQANKFGLSSVNDPIGKTDFDYFTDEHAQLAYADEMEIVRTGNPLIAKDEKETWADGSITWVSSTKLPISDENGRVIGTFGMSRDITRNIVVMEELKRAKMAADQANIAKSEFLANMSHEIRTPMSAIVGMTDLLIDSSLNPEQQEFAAIIQKSGNSLMAMISDILDFSKIEAGKLGLESIPFDLALAAGDSTELYAANAESKGIELILRVAPGPSRRLIGDPGRLRQVLNNLIGNAIKFTNKGHIFIDVSTRARSDAPGRMQVRIAVEDTGIGIPADKLGIIFDKFTQADSSTTREFGGTGLGLAICKELVSAMGGTLTVSSHQGKGSSFVLELELAQADTTRSMTSTGTPVDLSGLCVLVVEDNAINQRVYSEQLIAWGCKAVCCQTTTQALDLVRTGEFQIALIDGRVGEIGGLELARLIRKERTFSQLALILLTTVGRRGDGRAASEAGFNGYLVKPVRMIDLNGAISAMRQAQQAGQSNGDLGGLVTRHSLAEARGHGSSGTRRHVNSKS